MSAAARPRSPTSCPSTSRGPGRSRRARTRASSSSSRRCASFCARGGADAAVAGGGRGVSTAPTSRPAAAARVARAQRRPARARLAACGARVRDRDRAVGGARARTRRRSASSCRRSRTSSRRSGTSRDTFVSAGWFTFKEAVGGFILGSLAGIVVALVLARWRPLGYGAHALRHRRERDPDHRLRADHEQLVRDPLARASKIVIAAVICFFPVMINTLRGLTSVPPEAVELMRSYAARERDIYRRVRFPHALPFIFSALEGRDRPRHDRRHRRATTSAARTRRSGS